MLNRLHLKNFKCFEDHKFILKPLTVLSGLNGTGKSSVLQALLLLRQSYQQGVLQENAIVLNGDLVHIGTGKDALFEGAKKEEIFFELIFFDGKGHERNASWLCGYSSESDVLDVLSGVGDVQVIDLSLFTNDFQYLQAERIGPRRFFDLNFLVKKHNQLGIKGEYATHFLQEFGDRSLKAGLKGLLHTEAASDTLRDQVEAWMREVSPGIRINLIPNAGTDTVSLQYSFAMGTQVSNNYRATNVGFGITYILPILVAVLSSTPGTLILVENPEAHLHPRGQAMMGELLARAAACGIQIIVETHSDHVLNGIRVAVHDGKLKPEDAQLHYFQRREQDGFAEVVSPTIDRDGRSDQWPDGFFDEWDKNLEALLTPREE